MNPKMFDILVALKVIKGTSKDLHYAAQGLVFLPIHELADKLGDGLDDYIDDLIEVGWLGAGLEAPTAQSIHEAAARTLKAERLSQTELLMRLRFLNQSLLDLLDQCSNGAAAGAANLLGGIAQDIQQRVGFLDRVARGLDAGGNISRS